MKSITLHDKTFDIFINAEEIDQAISNVADQLNHDYKDKNPLFLVVLNGAFMFASDLFKKLTIGCEISFVKLSSYQGTETTEKVKQLIGLNEHLEDRDIVIVEDIVDTGITITQLMAELEIRKPKDVKICTFLLKPEKYSKPIPVNYVGISIPNAFVLGYGLDYDGLGRNLPDLYQLRG